MKLKLTIVGIVLAWSATTYAQDVDYLRDIKPILAKHCVACHGADKHKNNLRLDHGAGIHKGGNGGPVIKPGKSQDSPLADSILGQGDLVMPPAEKPRVPPAEIAKIKLWIDQGAKFPADEKIPLAAKIAKQHWAFVPPVRASLPPVKNQGWTRNAIDNFILARLEKEKITPSPEADRITLVRRLSLDLLGLPPTPAEVAEYLGDDRPGAYERLVVRLLASPHYGERWGRHWLDLARYADSHGYSIDAPRTIWPYRDWVINALNQDLPFDQFLTHQLAGDLLPAASPAHKVATGFHRNTQINMEGGIDLEQFRVEYTVDRVNTTGSVFLGLTVGCAQCHDHKYDPLSAREYYQLFAFFNSCDDPMLPLPTPEQAMQVERIRKESARLQQTLKGLDRATPARQAAWELGLLPTDKSKWNAELREAIEKPEYQRTAKEKAVVVAFFRQVDQLPAFLAGLSDGLPGGIASPVQAAGHYNLVTFRGAMEQRLADLKKKEPKVVTTLVLQERAKPRETHVMLRGDFLKKGVQVAPDVPAIFPPLPPKGEPGESRRTRLDLARWLLREDHPLTARVFVNRVWQQYFGSGLVETENDFGVQGTPPTHPELLDWLAREFMQPTAKFHPGGGGQGIHVRPWSIKYLHYLIVTSAAYRQSSNVRPDLNNVDARNRWLARQNRLRLEAEAVRDVALAASGMLDKTIGGPSVFPPQPDGVFVFTQVQREWKADTGPARYRRGMYTHFWRSAPHPALVAFDAPDGVNACTRRVRSNTPLQALTLLNDKGFYEFAHGLAKKVLQDGGVTDEARLRFAFAQCLARPPLAKEQQRMLDLIHAVTGDLQAHPKEAQRLAPPGLPAGVTPPQGAAWVLVSRVLLNLDEFITRE